MNLSEPVPFTVVAATILIFAVMFVVGVVFVKKHPKANKDNR